MNIDWSAPDKTKEAVVREAVSHLTFRNEDGLWMSYDAGVFMFSGITRAEMWSAVYDGWPKVKAYVAAHRTQEAQSLCKCGHEKSEHRDGIYECGCADQSSEDGFIGGTFIECECDDFEEQEAPAEAQEQPTHSAAELPQWVAELNENSKLDTYHFVGSEVRQLVGEIRKGLCALNAANARIAEARLLLNRAEPPNAMLDAKLLWIRERAEWMQKGTPDAR